MIITRTLQKRFVYYLGDNFEWVGIKDNARIFTDIKVVTELLKVLKVKFPKDKIGYIE